MKKHRFMRLEKLLFTLPLLVLTFPLWRNVVFEDNLDRAQRQLAGPTAVNLGRIYTYGHEREHWKLHEACATAFEAKTPFRARFDGRFHDDGIGDDILNPTHTFSASEAIVGTPDGKVYFVFLTDSNKRLTTVLVPRPCIYTYSDGTRRISSSTPISIPAPYD